MARLNNSASSRMLVREAAVSAIGRTPLSGIAAASRADNGRIRSEALRADTVSFDVFDTAIVRPLMAPDHLFWFLGSQPGPARNRRLEAERLARSEAEAFGRDEVTLTEIHHRASLLDPDGGWDATRLAALEVELEGQFCRPHPRALDLFNELKAAGSRLMFISDSYLERTTVIDLLERCGFVGWHDVHVSSTHGRTKRGGDLFDIVAGALVDQPSRWFHIGDTLIPDVVRPRLRGLRAGYVPRPIDQFRLGVAGLEPLLVQGTSCPAASVLIGLLANDHAARSVPLNPEAATKSVAALILTELAFPGEAADVSWQGIDEVMNELGVCTATESSTASWRRAVPDDETLERAEQMANRLRQLAAPTPAHLQLLKRSVVDYLTTSPR